MKTLCLPTGQIFHYVMTGKFEAPSSDWIHEDFDLNEYELFAITEGTLYLTYANENFTINSGEYLLLPPCNSRRKGFRPSYCSFFWLHFSTIPGELPIFLPSGEADTAHTLPNDCYFTLPQTGKIPKPEKVAVLMKQLQDMAKRQYPSIALDSMTTSIITELYGQLSLLLPIDLQTRNQKQIYFDIIDYIKTNISRNVKIAEIAHHFGYNEKYLSHRFAEITGVSLKQYILQTKVDTANFMLTDTNKSIADIARELGFSDSHNFTRAYKKLTGLSPSEYRNAFSKRLLYHA